MAAKSSTLSPAQHKAIEALLVAHGLKHATEIAGVGYRSLRGWLIDDSAFQAAYATARPQATHQAIASLQRGASDAARVLMEIAADSNVPPAHRVNASKAILDLAIRAVELEDLENRISNLEAAYAAQNAAA